jgi:hypothetical protein
VDKLFVGAVIAWFAAMILWAVGTVAYQTFFRYRQQ